MKSSAPSNKELAEKPHNLSAQVRKSINSTKKQLEEIREKMIDGQWTDDGITFIVETLKIGYEAELVRIPNEAAEIIEQLQSRIKSLESSAPELERTIVCLVGSVKQVEDWRRWTSDLTAKGYVVLEAGLYGTIGEGISQQTWDLVTKIHQQKIRMSDVVAVITKPDGTVGEHTNEDVAYARAHGIPIYNVKIVLEQIDEVRKREG